MMLSGETNLDADIDKYSKVSDLVKHVHYYNFTVFKRCENHIYGHQTMCKMIFKTNVSQPN